MRRVLTEGEDYGDGGNGVGPAGRGRRIVGVETDTGHVVKCDVVVN